MNKIILSILVLISITALGLGSLTAYGQERYFWQERNGYNDNYNQSTEDEIMQLKQTISNLEQEIQQTKNLDYPKNTIKDTQIYIEFLDSKDNFYQWNLPIDTFENNVIRSNILSYAGSKLTANINTDSFWSSLKDKIKNKIGDIVNVDTVKLTISSTGETYRFQDYRQFSNESFTNVVDQIYDNSKSNSDFIYEVWFIVSQLTVYDDDVNPQSEGRYPIETLVRTGGDCEDLSILIADLIKSSSYTKNWEIKLVYLDIDNPKNPKKINHVAVYVNDGEYDYYIESTSSPRWDYYPNGIKGWYYEL